MSISKEWVGNATNQLEALSLYRSRGLLTIEAIARQLDTTTHNVQHVLKFCMPAAERRALAKLRYSASKTGSKNPMTGKTGEQHHNWQGECEDGYGYLTCLHNGKRQLVHRIVMAEALSLQELPESLDVHHIDGNTKNNDLDNLALVTKAGHKRIHFMQVKDSLSLQLKKSSIADALKYMT
jgi:hypothetical protein